MLRRLAGLAAACVLAAAMAAATGAQEVAPPAPPDGSARTAVGGASDQLPIAAFAQLPFVEKAVISPDGTRWAGLLGVGGSQVVAIVSLFDKTEKIRRFTLPDLTEVAWIQWVNPDNLIVGVNMLHDVGGDDWYFSRVIALNRVTGKVTPLLSDLGGQQAADVIWLPTTNSNEILISGQDSVYLGEDFWPAVHRVDVTTGNQRVIVEGHAGVTGWSADADGVVRAGIGYDDSTRSIRLLYRRTGGGTAFHTVSQADLRRDQSIPVPMVFVPGGDHALVLRDDERGFSGIYDMDLVTQTAVRTEYASPAGAVDGVIMSRDRTALLGIYSTAPAVSIHWFDDDLSKLQTQFAQAVPNSGAAIESLSDDRKSMLVRISAADSPGSLYFYSVEGSALHRIAYINSILGGRHLAPVTVISYQARDGLEIHGLLTLPVGRKPQKLPLVIMPHGGPWAHDVLEYDYWVQFLANRGYAVLQPDFRGSTGYGTSFERKADGQLGLAMQDDVSDGVKWAVTQGIADAGRVCIVGASYGGYAAMWGIAKDPGQYRCSISVAGVSSLSREVNSFANATFGNHFQDEWKRLAPDFGAVSPINATQQIRAPLLLIHGKKDVTVPHRQSALMYERMRKSGKNVEFVSLPLADHYFSRQEDRVALLTAIEAFLKKYNPAD